MQDELSFEELIENILLEEKRKKTNPAYVEGLPSSDVAARRKEIEKGSKTDSSDKSAYADSRFKTDFTDSGERRETPESTHTKKFRRMFGEGENVTHDLLEEDFEIDMDLYLLREFIEEVLFEKKSNVTAALKNKAERKIV